MKRALSILMLSAISALLANAQFGLGKLKDKVNGATQKAKPVSDRTERAIENFTAWTPEEEQQIGEATAAKMIAMFGVVDSPKLVRYVNLVGQAVAQYAPRQVPYRFGILDSEIVGAFALPGGFIFITKTAIEGMNNEAQLAGALGHEIVHVSERHLESAIRSKKNSAWASEEAKAKTSSTTPEFLRSRADAFLKDMFTMRLSRDKEDGADERGSLMAVQAGYAASGLLEFLRTLDAAESKPQNQRAFGQLLSTHPPFKDRIARLTPIVESSAKNGKTLEARFTAALK
jgi:beta-barrel assembly-enhancing protease